MVNSTDIEKIRKEIKVYNLEAEWEKEVSNQIKEKYDNKFQAELKIEKTPIDIFIKVKNAIKPEDKKPEDKRCCCMPKVIFLIQIINVF